MSANPAVVTERRQEIPVPAWHTIMVLAVFFAGSVISARVQGLERINIPGLSVRLSSYLTVIAEEWLVVCFVWWALRRRGVSVGNLISGVWKNSSRWLEDIAFAFAFLVGWSVLAFSIAALLKLAPPAGARAVLPKTGIEALVFFFLACTAGFCEEFIFRGYLERQFSLWTGSVVAGVVIQGIAFGLAHGYQGPKFMAIIALEGCCLGLMARWRGSLRSVMMAHAIQDSLAILAYFTGM
jgi:uncharacterized protein